MNNLMDNEKIMNFYKDKSLNDKMLHSRRTPLTLISISLSGQGIPSSAFKFWLMDICKALRQ